MTTNLSNLIIGDGVGLRETTPPGTVEIFIRDTGRVAATLATGSSLNGIHLRISDEAETLLVFSAARPDPADADAAGYRYQRDGGEWTEWRDCPIGFALRMQDRGNYGGRPAEVRFLYTHRPAASDRIAGRSAGINEAVSRLALWERGAVGEELTYAEHAIKIVAALLPPADGGRS